MNLQKVNPWNWFRHEDSSQAVEEQVPLRREEFTQQQPGRGSLAQFRKEVDRFLEDAFRGFGWPAAAAGGSPGARAVQNGFLPQVDVASDGKEYTVTVEAAGLGEDDINITLQERRLVISGEKKEEHEEKDKQFYRVERSFGHFQRVLALPEDADAEAINASMKNGVLKITIPRAPGADTPSKSIPIDKS